ncbi:MAG: hypothetical protein Q9Q40_14365, partial [Acidobacteriota bacterium]|nr:hypothetical protein [Acidobacteriota bacterium]
KIREPRLSAPNIGHPGAGDRVPSGRGMARITGFNPDTAHRAYLALAREDALVMGAGSRTCPHGDLGSVVPLTPAWVVNRARHRLEAAKDFGLSPAEREDCVTRLELSPPSNPP